MSERAETLRHALTVVALDLEGVVLDGAAGPAEVLELRGQALERRPALAQAAYHRDDLARAVAAIAEDADDDVARILRSARGGRAARCGGWRRDRPGASSVGGVDETAPRHGA